MNSGNVNRLKELRLEKGYTQIKIQMMTGIDQSDYSKIESGKMIRYNHFFRLFFCLYIKYGISGILINTYRMIYIHLNGNRT